MTVAQWWSCGHNLISFIKFNSLYGQFVELYLNTPRSFTHSMPLSQKPSHTDYISTATVSTHSVFSTSKFSCTYVGHGESLLAYSSRIDSAKSALHRWVETSFSCHSPVALIIREVRILVLTAVPWSSLEENLSRELFKTSTERAWTSERLLCRRLCIQYRLEFMFLCVLCVVEMKHHPICSYHKSLAHFSLSTTSFLFHSDFAQRASPSPLFALTFPLPQRTPARLPDQ